MIRDGVQANTGDPTAVNHGHLLRLVLYRTVLSFSVTIWFELVMILGLDC